MKIYRIISAEELARCNGKDGQCALVGYKGFVYDVTPSKLWRKGMHVNKHPAGIDLSAEMADAPHLDDVMERFPIVGVLQGFEHLAVAAAEGAALSAGVGAGPAAGAANSRAGKTVAEPDRLSAWLLGFHPHPISVHFPIALGLVAALLTLAEVLLPLCGAAFTPGTVQALNKSALINLLICALFTPLAIFTGWLSWHFNYQSLWNTEYTAKIRLSWLLGALILLSLALRVFAPGADSPGGGAAYWAYSLCVIALGPVVVALGYYGGRVTFPPVKR